jgi:multidrug resistance efflux pump
LDIVREKPKSRKKYFYGIGALAAVVSVTVALSNLEPAAPSVERATLWIDSVARGTMIRQVRAPGTLVPEQMRYIPAITAGRIEQVHVRPGTPVMANTVLLELSNPEVQLELLSAQQQLTAAEAALVTLRTNLETQRLNQQGVVAQIKSQYQEAKRQAQVIAELDQKGLSSTNEAARAKDQAAELAERLQLEQDRLKVQTGSINEQISLQEAQVRRLRAIAAFQVDRVQSMKVTAGADGVLQEMALEPGQWVNPGTILGRVAQPGRLKAVLRVPETQAKDVALGQPTAVDTRNGIASGHVMRIDPSSQNGTVQVEVALEGELPRGARPDLSVDGTIEIERLTDVMYVGRPAYGQAESTVGLFKIDPEDDKTARRVNVKLGRSSVNTIEVMQGLNVGDRVIISDMSQWDNQDRIRLK